MALFLCKRPPCHLLKQVLNNISPLNELLLFDAYPITDWFVI
jgi:hypothetical protein